MTKKQTENMRYFKGIWMPKNIYLNNNLNWTEKILLVEIDSLDDGRGCFASNKYFAEFLGVTQRSITTAIAKLKKLKLVEQVCFNGKIRTLKSNLNGQSQGEEETKNNKVKEKTEKEEKINNNTEKKEKEIEEKNEVKKEIKEKTKKEENNPPTKNSLEVYFHSAPKFTSSLPRSKLLGSIYSINNTNNNIINNKKDKSFLEKEDSFSNQNLKSFHDFSFRNDLDLGSYKTEAEDEDDENDFNSDGYKTNEKEKNDEKTLDLEDNKADEEDKIKEKCPKEEPKETKEIEENKQKEWPSTQQQTKDKENLTNKKQTKNKQTHKTQTQNISENKSLASERCC
jgi:hypothetical protein